MTTFPSFSFLSLLASASAQLRPSCLIGHLSQGMVPLSHRSGGATLSSLSSAERMSVSACSDSRVAPGGVNVLHRNGPHIESGAEAMSCAPLSPDLGMGALTLKERQALDAPLYTLSAVRQIDRDLTKYLGVSRHASDEATYLGVEYAWSGDERLRRGTLPARNLSSSCNLTVAKKHRYGELVSL